jgi:hypothetical protein
LEAHIESLTQQNAELLHRRPEQPNLEMNRDEREEEDHNSKTNPRREERSHDPHTLFHDYIHQRNYRMKRIDFVAHHER